MTAARSRRAGRGRKVTQETKQGTTRTGAKKAREFAKKRAEDYAYFSPHMGPIKPKPKAAQTGTSRKAMRDAPKPEREVKRGTTRTAAAKARSMQGPNPEGAAKRTLEPKAPQTGTSRKARRDAPKPKQEIKRGTTRTRQPRVERDVVPGTTRVRKTADSSKKTDKPSAPTLNRRGATGGAAFFASLDAASKRKAAKKTSGSTSTSTSAKPSAKVKTEKKKDEKKKDEKKKTILGLEVKPSKNGRFAGRGGKRRRVAGRAMGGMMKSKMASKGGAKGGRMPTGMKDGGSLEMTMVGGRKVPAFAADGKGANDLAKKKNGGMQAGGMMKSVMKSKTPSLDPNRFISVDEFEGRTPRGLPKRKKSVIPATTSEKRPSSRGTAVMRSKGGTIKKPGGMKNGGMAKMGPKGYAKGGAATKKKAVSRKPRGVGVALRGFGKALKK